ncbi:receptor expression-enhancing protein 2-like isoform X1 [Dreissena polymorpha]|uniref:receptor expression-enhancing protein 2-like isoform X1 n=1 Tax=Dreissena polymorpha TaxID=45954 RepID=UPI00226484A6|nr:receptor expression-enhancing protein 2-like isoform X1 [Dreissena polymorpha]
MVSAILSRVVILVFGLLYPAYASYKAVKTKNVREYVKWMMYWIVFALFCAVETFADVFLSWLPFYYEVKIIFVFWLLSPITRGSSFIYRKFIHPQLNKHEKEIDEAIAQARTKGYRTLMTLGHKGLTYAHEVVVSTAIKGQSTLIEQMKKSFSTNDLRVHESRPPTDDTDGLPYIDDSDEDFGLKPEQPEIQTQISPKIVKPVTKGLPMKPPMKPSKSAKQTENRLRSDNQEISRREKQDRQEKALQRRPLSRSNSDAADHRPRKARPSSGLSRLEEVEHENSMATESRGSDEEFSETYTEEVVYFQPLPKKMDKHYTQKDVKSDPYATLPRTRSRHRPRLNQP